MFWNRWLFSIIVVICSVKIGVVELKPGISGSHGKVVNSNSYSRDSNIENSASNVNRPRSFVHDKNTFASPRTELPTLPKLLCPKGYDLIGESCVLSHTIPANIECPENFEVFKTGLSVECVRNHLIDAQFECSNGIPPKITGNIAYCPTEHYDNPLIECPHGTIQKENECIIIEKKPPILKCFEGYSLDKNSNCKQVIELKPILKCPPETTLEKTTMTCVSKVIVEPLEVCPPGAIPVKSRDLNDLKSLLNKITDSSYSRRLQEIPTLGSLNQLNSKRDASVQDSTKNTNFNPNNINSNTNQDQNSQKGANIPSNQFKDRNYLTTGSNTINKNFDSSNDSFKSSMKIHENSPLKNDYIGLANPQIDYVNNNTIKSKLTTQEDTFYKTLYDSSKNLKNNGGIINESLVGDEIVCLILQYTDPHIECPPGLELNKNGICTYHDSFVPKKTCEGGIEPNSDNMCVIEKLLPAEVECPKEYTLDVISGMCIKKEVEELICPKDTILNKTTMKCETDPKCPLGFIMNNSTLNCENEKSELPHPKCPEGTEYEEKSSSCKVKDAQLPLIMCPEGYEQKGDECVLNKNIPASYYCPSDYYQTNRNLCVKWYQDYMLQCPPFLELKEESFAFRTDLIPPPAAGRGPVIPFGNIERKLQQYLYNDLDDLTQQDVMKSNNFIPSKRNGEFDENYVNQKRRYENLGSSTPIVIKSFKTKGMVCFGWGRRYKMIVNCPEETTLLNDKCVETRIMEPDNTCTKGYVFSEIESLCIFKKKIMPNMECPPFMKLGTSINGSPMCIGDRREPAQVNCPEGFEWLVDTLSCQNREFTQPKISCIKGYSIIKENTGTFCQRKDTIKPTPSCPPEYRYDHIDQVCIYELKLHDIRERDEYSRNHALNIRTNINF